jgi:hypothetical protein
MSITVSELESALKSVGLGDRDRVIAALRSKGLLPKETVPVKAADHSLVTLRAAASQSQEKAQLVRRIMATATRWGVDLDLDKPVSLAVVDRQLRANPEAMRDVETRMTFKHWLFCCGVIPA